MTIESTWDTITRKCGEGGGRGEHATWCTYVACNRLISALLHKSSDAAQAFGRRMWCFHANNFSDCWWMHERAWKRCKHHNPFIFPIKTLPLQNKHIIQMWWITERTSCPVSHNNNNNNNNINNGGWDHYLCLSAQSGVWQNNTYILLFIRVSIVHQLG